MCSFQRIARKVMEFHFFGHGKSWNLKCQKEYEPWVIASTLKARCLSGLEFVIRTSLEAFVE